MRTSGPSIATLLEDLATAGHVVERRLPAISVFLPELARLGPTFTATLRDGRLAGLTDWNARPTCGYGPPRQSPTIDGSRRLRPTVTARRPVPGCGSAVGPTCPARLATTPRPATRGRSRATRSATSRYREYRW
ncbi:MAG: hypothetical protein JO100_05130 [Pseudonocardia sp.]|nr:hypothetical protein [Pseudonocardia sp.]